MYTRQAEARGRLEVSGDPLRTQRTGASRGNTSASGAVSVVTSVAFMFVIFFLCFFSKRRTRQSVQDTSIERIGYCQAKAAPNTLSSTMGLSAKPNICRFARDKKLFQNCY